MFTEEVSRRLVLIDYCIWFALVLIGSRTLATPRRGCSGMLVQL